jgi:hypothetical protein
VRQVALDGAVGHEQGLGDLAVGESFGRQLGDATLAGGESFETGEQHTPRLGSRCPQLGLGAVGEVPGAHAVGGVERLAQHLARPFQVSTATFAPVAALARTALAAVVVMLSLSSTFAFALLLSTKRRNPYGAMAGGVGLGIVSRAVDNIPGLHHLGPWLPVSDGGSTAWTSLFFPSADVGSIVQLLVVQAMYTTVFLVAAWRQFVRADVLS